MKESLKKWIGENRIRWWKSRFPSSEERELDRKRVGFYSGMIRKHDLFFDVGANYGNRIGPVLQLNAKVVAFEPLMECADYLHMKFGNRICLERGGIGSEEKEVLLKVPKAKTIASMSEDFISSTKSSGRFSEFEWSDTRKVKITTLDAMIRKYGKPDFIKIDVEGYELEVLKGLSEPVSYLSFEYTVPEQNDLLFKCIDRLVLIYRSNLLFNYSIGESMQWASESWWNVDEFKNHISSHDFIQTGFGDVYVKLNLA